jgi:hypothetical protein
VSDLLTHWAVMDDCRRLMPSVDGIAPEFGRCLNQHHRVARLGAVTRAGANWMPPVLRWTRENWEDPAMHPEVEIKLAFCVAGLTHAACDLHMKRLRIKSVLADENSDNPTEDDVARLVYAYHDTHVFRRVYGDGEEGPFNPFMMADIQTDAGRTLEAMAKALFRLAIIRTRDGALDAPELDRDDLESYVQKVARRVLEGSESVRYIIGSRGLCRQSLYDWLRELRREEGEEPDWETIQRLLAPDTSDPGARLDNLLINEPPLYVDHERLVRVYHRPDPEKMDFYGIESAFYDEDDPAIRAARAVQGGVEPSDDEIRRALQPGSNRSAYGRALETAMAYERQGTAYWLGESDTLEAPNLGRAEGQTFRHRHDTEADQRANARF